jgi:hypothetical protein
MSKVITYKGIAKYIFDNVAELQVSSKNIVTPGFIIGDLNRDNCTIYMDISDVPGDFNGDKYLYDGTWALNPDYLEY